MSDFNPYDLEAVARSTPKRSSAPVSSPEQIRQLIDHWREIKASGTARAVELSRQLVFEGAAYERGKADARGFCAADLEAAIKIAEALLRSGGVLPQQKSLEVQKYRSTEDEGATRVKDLQYLAAERATAPTNETSPAKCAWCHLVVGHDEHCPFSPDGDKGRWEAIEEALSTPRLTSELSRLAAISAIVNSRKPLTAAETAHALELAKKYGWEVSVVLPQQNNEDERTEETRIGQTDVDRESSRTASSD